MGNKTGQFCFCTLALGKSYCQLAILLATDLQKYSPGSLLIVLTDRPEDFSNYSQVLAVRHRIRGVKCYHDKRFAITKGLSMFDTCIFIDADMRILEAIPEDLTWLSPPGIIARICTPMRQKFTKAVEVTATKEFIKEYNLVKQTATMLEIESEWEDILFVHEFLFTVSRDSGKEIEFLNLWSKIAYFLELNGCFIGEGNAISLAAHKVGMEIRWSDMPGIYFFNHKIEFTRIKQGQSSMEKMSKYFEEHDNILFQKKSITKKIFDKLERESGLLYRKARLNILNQITEDDDIKKILSK